jgi:hypothetical protein
MLNSCTGVNPADWFTGLTITLPKNDDLKINRSKFSLFDFEGKRSTIGFIFDLKVPE